MGRLRAAGGGRAGSLPFFPGVASLAAEMQPSHSCLLLLFGPALINTFQSHPIKTMATTRTMLRPSPVAGALPARAQRAAAVGPRVSTNKKWGWRLAASLPPCPSPVCTQSRIVTRIERVCVREHSPSCLSPPSRPQAALRPSLAAPLAAPARAARAGRVGSVAVRANKQIQVSVRVGAKGREGRGERGPKKGKRVDWLTRSPDQRPRRGAAA